MADFTGFVTGGVSLAGTGNGPSTVQHSAATGASTDTVRFGDSKITLGAIDRETAGTLTIAGTGSVATSLVIGNSSITTTINGTITIAESQNIILGTTTGTKIGTTTSQKLGFFNATPVVQRADIGLLTDNTGGSADNTIANISGTGDDTNINNNFADLTDQVNLIRTVLRDLGLMA